MRTLGALLFLSALLLPGVSASAQTSTASPFGLLSDLEAGPLVMLAGDADDDIFQVRYPDPALLRPKKKPKDGDAEYFSEFLRVSVASGVLIPLIAQESSYHFGWWSKLYFHRELDFGFDAFRTMAELSMELGQSTSTRADQDWRIVSTLYFFKLRAMADFMPESTSDLYLFGGVGLGVERARGHRVSLLGFERISETNISPLLEAGAGVSMAVSPNFMLDLRISTTWPMASTNIILYLNVDLGVSFLFY